MSHETENKQCQICKGYLFEDDDIVICPVCGAPHHRDCYSAVGHCGVEENHGTDMQYDKLTEREAKAKAESDSKVDEDFARECRFCHRTSRTKDGDFCPYCGQPYSGNGRTHNGPGVFAGGIPVFDACGGIPKESKIEDVKAEHIAKFVGANSHRYVPKFALLTPQSKKSWNWAAFLSPSAWCFSRKMVLPGVMYFILMLASALCFVPFNATLSEIVTDEMQNMNYLQLANELATNYMSEFSVISIVMSFIGLVLNVLPRIICGITGDWLYRGFTLQNVRKITANPDIDDVEAELMKKGSVNIFVLVAVLLAQSYLPMMISEFIW